MTVKRSAFLLICLTMLSSAKALADPGSPVGLWKSYDDAGTRPSALIRIMEINGVLHGHIERLFLQPGEAPNPVCDKCQGARKDKPITGMLIMTNMRKEKDEYLGGEILDPENGETYKCTLRLSRDGKKLNVRGYIGVPLLGRSQVWVREE
jgi:hypothetical protein